MEGNLENIFAFLEVAEKLKSTLRYNKTTAGRQESTADHSWRLALMVPIVAKELSINIDVEKCMKIALVHDLAEALTGDIDAVAIAEGRITKEQKTAKELEVMEKIKNLLPGQAGIGIYSLWQEYETASTKEGRFVKGLDKLETLTQLAEAGCATYDKPDFIADYTERAINNFPELKDILITVKEKLKKEFAKGGFDWRQ